LKAYLKEVRAALARLSTIIHMPDIEDPTGLPFDSEGRPGEGAEHSTHPQKCQHEWADLVDDSEFNGFACGLCAESWDHSDGTHVLVHSATHILDELVERLTSLEDLVSTRFNITYCMSCNRWAERTELVDLGPWFACPDHIGHAIGNPGQEPEPLRRASAYIREHNIASAKTLSARAQWEQIVAISPDLASEFEDNDSERAALRNVTLPRRVAVALNLETAVPFGALVSRLAIELDTSTPAGRTAGGYLITLLDQAVQLSSRRYKSQTLEDLIEERLLTLATLYDDVYGDISVELSGVEKGSKLTIDSEIAAQALALLSRRGVHHLISKIKGTTSS